MNTIRRSDAIDALMKTFWFLNPDSITDVIMCVEDAQPQQWIPCSERLPENTDPVNITWVNRNPPVYYASIKDVPYVATGCYCNGKWWWYSAVCQDYLDEYGESHNVDAVDEDIEIIAWMPLPEPYREKQKEGYPEFRTKFLGEPYREETDNENQHK